MNELQLIAEYLGGDLFFDELYISIWTGDNTSKENYDDMLDFSDEVRDMLSKYEILEMWADHDTQIIEFKIKE